MAVLAGVFGFGFPLAADFGLTRACGFWCYRLVVVVFGEFALGWC